MAMQIFIRSSVYSYVQVFAGLYFHHHLNHSNTKEYSGSVQLIL